MTGIDAEAGMDFDGLVKLRFRGGQNEIEAFTNIILLLGFDAVLAIGILFAVFHILVPPQSPTMTPMLRAVPATMDIAASTLPALRSGIFSSAISRT